LITVVLAGAASLAAPHVVFFAITLGAMRGAIRDSQIIPRALTWLFGPPPAWYEQRRNHR